jgi:hypothetical protein
MASLTSPVKVWLLPAASAGTAANPANICIPRTAAAIRFTFMVISSPVKWGDGSETHSPGLRCHAVKLEIPRLPSGYKIFGLHNSLAFSVTAA